MRPIYIEGETIDDMWFWLLKGIVNKDFTYEVPIDRGSFEKEHIRTQFDYATFMIKKPAGKVDTPDRLTVTVPAGVVHPCSIDFLHSYFVENFFNPDKKDEEDYTYGNRLFTHDQICKVLDMLKETPHTNQAILRISVPEDIDLKDPPCLLAIVFRVFNGILNCSVVFRSWDLFGAWPANIGAIQMLKEFYCSETGLKDGVLIGASHGLHIYDYQKEAVAGRLGMKGWK